MIEKHKVEVKTVSGIDALYYQLKVNFVYYSKFYDKCKLENVTSLSNMEIISFDWFKQYTFFNFLDNGDVVARIGFKNLNTTDGLEFIKVQLDTAYMNTYGVLETYQKVILQINSLGLDVLGDKIMRIDINSYVYGYDFSYLDVGYFDTAMHTDYERRGVKKVTETIYLGKRNNGKAPLLRIYNKWLELLSNDNQQRKQAIINYKFYKQHGIILDTNVPLWQVEWELKREYLRLRYNLSSVIETLDCVNTLFNDMMSSHKLMVKRYKNTKKENKRIAPVWLIVKDNYNFNDSNTPKARLKIKKYVKDEVWLTNRINEYFKSNPVCDYDTSKLKYYADKLIEELSLVKLNNTLLNQRLEKEMN